MTSHGRDQVADERGVDLLRALDLRVAQEGHHGVDPRHEPVQVRSFRDGTLVDIDVRADTAEFLGVPGQDPDPVPVPQGQRGEMAPGLPGRPEHQERAHAEARTHR